MNESIMLTVESIMLTEVCQKENGILYILFYIYHLYMYIIYNIIYIWKLKNNTNECRYKTETDLQT